MQRVRHLRAKRHAWVPHAIPSRHGAALKAVLPHQMQVVRSTLLLARRAGGQSVRMFSVALPLEDDDTVVRARVTWRAAACALVRPCSGGQYLRDRR
jgi:hypothetical protein